MRSYFKSLSIINYPLSILLFIFITSTSWAQTGDVRGFVYEEDNSEPVPYASVFLKGTQHIGQTNNDGFFAITKVPAGDYTILVTTIGFDTIKQSISVKVNDIITKKFFLKKSMILT